MKIIVKGKYYTSEISTNDRLFIDMVRCLINNPTFRSACMHEFFKKERAENQQIDDLK